LCLQATPIYWLPPPKWRKQKCNIANGYDFTFFANHWKHPSSLYKTSCCPTCICKLKNITNNKTRRWYVSSIVGVFIKAIFKKMDESKSSQCFGHFCTYKLHTWTYKCYTPKAIKTCHQNSIWQRDNIIH
jgi:hypothetical protein